MFLASLGRHDACDAVSLNSIRVRSIMKSLCISPCYM